MTTPTAVQIKRTEIAWQKRAVVTTQLSDQNALRPYLVLVVGADDMPLSRATPFASAAAADLQHEKLVHQLASGERTSA